MKYEEHRLVTDTGYQKNKAAEKYKKELITLSQAAKESNTTLWEFQKYLIEEGYTSTYSLKDLQEETQNL